MTDLTLLNERLIKLETQAEERWNAHDLRASEMRAEISAGFAKIRENTSKIFDLVNGVQIALGKLPCGERLRDFKNNRRIIWSIIAFGGTISGGIIIFFLTTWIIK